MKFQPMKGFELFIPWQLVMFNNCIDSYWKLIPECHGIPVQFWWPSLVHPVLKGECVFRGHGCHDPLHLLRLTGDLLRRNEPPDLTSFVTA